MKHEIKNHSICFLRAFIEAHMACFIDCMEFSMTSAIAQTTVALERIQKILSADEIIREHPDAADPGRVSGAIAFENIAFGYDDETQVLRDVSFRIEPGQVVGIVGPTGSGKSTVLSLVPRFYDPNGNLVFYSKQKDYIFI